MIASWLIIDPPFCWLAMLSLLHTLWQGVLLALFVALITKVTSPRWLVFQYHFSFTCLIVFAMLPWLNAAYLSDRISPPTQVVTAKQKFDERGKLSLYLVTEIPNRPDQAHFDSPPSQNRVAVSPRENSDTLFDHESKAINWLMLVSFLTTIAYALGVCMMVIRLCSDLWLNRNLVKRVDSQGELDWIPERLRSAGAAAAHTLGRTLTTPIAMFEGQGSLLLVGFVRPIILINSSLASGLTPSQLEQAFAHELAHLYRYDPWMQLLQRGAESFMFFHPCFWWISRKVSDLRELCCDQIVSEAYENTDYALTLLACAEFEANQSEFSCASTTHGLAIVGHRVSQLSLRIRAILSFEQKPAHRRSLNHRPWFGPIALLISIMGLTVAISIPSQTDLTARDQHTNLAYTQQEKPPANVRFQSDQWQWQFIKPSELRPTQFMFGGQSLDLQSDTPFGVSLGKEISAEDLQFAQLDFGDSGSPRVALAVQLAGPNIKRLYVDSNRDRILSANEACFNRAADGRIAVTELDVVVSDADRQVVSKRQIAITSKTMGHQLRVSTLGYAAGEIQLNSEAPPIAARRIDVDGNGIPLDPTDQLWLDLNRDGTFDPITERIRISQRIKLADVQYLASSDKLGQRLELKQFDKTGRIHFSYAPTPDSESANGSPQVTRLEGVIRDDTGMLFSIEQRNTSLEVPTGNYSLASLFIEVVDEHGTTWQSHLMANERIRFSVKQDKTVEIPLLESPTFSLVPRHDPFATGHQTRLEASLQTKNGLVVTSLKKSSQDHSQPSATFQIAGTVNDEGFPVVSNSCYG